MAPFSSLSCTYFWPCPEIGRGETLQALLSGQESIKLIARESI